MRMVRGRPILLPGQADSCLFRFGKARCQGKQTLFRFGKARCCGQSHSGLHVEIDLPVTQPHYNHCAIPRYTKNPRQRQFDPHAIHRNRHHG